MHGFAQAFGDSRQQVEIHVVGGGFHDGSRPSGRVFRFEDAAAHEDGLGAQLHHQGGVGGSGHAAGGKVGHGHLAVFFHIPHQFHRRTDVLSVGNQFLVSQGGDMFDLSLHRPHVSHRFHDVAGTGLTFGADHGRAFGDAAEGFPQIPAAAYKRHFELVLVDVILLIGGREHLALVDKIHSQGFQNLSFGEMADAALGHHRDGDGFLNLLDQFGIAHAGHASLRANVGGNALQGHHCHRAGIFGDFGLLGVGDIHDHPALEHLRQPNLQFVILIRQHDETPFGSSLLGCGIQITTDTPDFYQSWFLSSY